MVVVDASAYTAEPIVVSDGERLRDLSEEAARQRFVALDVEASGMHAYRATACVIQLAWDDGRTVVIVDALATSLDPLEPVLGAGGPFKIIHDVAFDARLLGLRGLLLGRVHDTAIAAQMLGRKSTGLASLLESELGVRIGKELQHLDWRTRPLDSAMIAYLGHDVAHLEALDRKLWAEVVDRGIEPAVLAETDYRITCADPAREPSARPPAYMRMKGAHRLDEHELAVLRAVFLARERRALARDVPPYMVAPHEALLALARAQPATAAQVGRVRGMPSSPEALAFREEMARAIATAGDRLPEDERVHLDPPRPPMAIVQARKERESRLVAWRHEQAALRGLDEQVVLPGHCLRDAAALETFDHDALSRVPGIGTFRLERDGEAILRALRGAESLTS